MKSYLPFLRPLAVAVLALAAASITAHSGDTLLDLTSRHTLSGTLMAARPPSLLPPGFIWTQAHADALDLYIGNRKILAVFEYLTVQPRTRDEITQWLGGDGFARADMDAVLRDLFERHLTQAPFAQDWSTILLNPYGQRVAQAMTQLPEQLKSYAMCWNWTHTQCPAWYYPLPPS